MYRIPRHIKSKHKNEETVKEILKMSKANQTIQFGILRRNGDFEANMKTARETSDYVTVVRKSKVLNVANYAPCIKCLGLYNNRTIIRHMSTCRGDADGGNNKNQIPSEKRPKVAAHLKSSRMLLTHYLNQDDTFAVLKKEVLGRMVADEITGLIDTDEGLLLYGFTMFEKGGSATYNEISNKLRNIARLVLVFRNVAMEQEATSFSLIDPGNWDNLIKAMKQLVNHEGNDNVGVPSLLLRVGRSLESIAQAKRAVGIKTKNHGMIEDSRLFLELHQQYWSIYSSHALSTIASKKDKTPELLPLTSDMQLLRSFLLEQIEPLLRKCDDGSCLSLDCWKMLQKLIVVRIITFNARRGGEPTKIKLEDWNRCNQWKRTEDIDNIKDPLEKLLAKRLKVLYVKGKRKRRVPILFTKEVQEAIELLLSAREKVGVSVHNEYLFPRPTRDSKGHVRGWDVIHEISTKARLQKPELVTSTKIRKHIATVLQLLDMNDAELSWITDHLGHSADVHKKWYRQEESTIELTKVAKILIAKDRGVSFHNKKMNDVLGTYISFREGVFLLWTIVVKNKKFS